MINDVVEVEKAMRRIESVVDQHHKSFGLFKYERGVALLHLLRVFDDMCRLGPIVTGMLLPPELLDTHIHKNLDCLDMAVKWICECCPVEPSKTDMTLYGEVYIEAGKVLHNSGNYRDVCDSYVLWSRKRQEVVINEEINTIYFKYPSTGSDVEAADLVLREKKKVSALETKEYENCQLELTKVLPKLKSAVSVNEYTVQYKITEEIWDAFINISKLQISHMFELPDEWEFQHFTLGEFKSLWTILLTKAQIHNAACLYSGIEGGGVESIIMVFSQNELYDYIERKTNLQRDRIQAIINFITYDPNVKNTDIVMQPIIKLNQNQYIISPNLIMTSSAERNIISLINKLDQPSYSRISNKKEDIMVSRLLTNLSSKWKHLLFAVNMQLPSPLPDMDFICYDPVTKIMFIGELKWLLSTDSIQEVCARDEDLAKGISQAKLIFDYVKNNPDDCINRIFCDSSFKISDIFVCVISKNNIGTSALDRAIPIINEDSFIDIFDKYDGDLRNIIDCIKNGDFLPKSGEDFEVIMHTVEYAGYEFQFEAVNIGPPINNTKFSRKVGRNEPCPCGRIDTNTGRAIKYKKCCGRSK